jgi:flavin reductase (DIM6/NTAB) family NADH-FMN oxidoreductase RutF
MFYATADRDRTKLPRDPFKAIVAPRPIGWISTRALDGRVNLAPYSFFNGFSSVPPIVGFSSEGWKDSATFAKESGEFVANLATFDLRERMNETSAPFARGDNEFARVGLTWRNVASSRRRGSPRAPRRSNARWSMWSRSSR